MTLLPVQVDGDERWVLHQLLRETAKDSRTFTGQLVDRQVRFPAVPEGELWLVDRIVLAVGQADAVDPALVFIDPLDGGVRAPDRDGFEVSRLVDSASFDLEHRGGYWLAVIDRPHPIQVSVGAELGVLWAEMQGPFPQALVTWSATADIRVLRRR